MEEIEYPERVMCPLVDEMIGNYECVENVDCIDGIIIIESLPRKFKVKENFKEICINCKYHNY